MNNARRPLNNERRPRFILNTLRSDGKWEEPPVNLTEDAISSTIRACPTADKEATRAQALLTLTSLLQSKDELVRLKAAIAILNTTDTGGTT